MSKPMFAFLRVRPALAHFGRCWRQLRRTSSRRTLELALAGVMLSQVFRLLQAVRVIPAFHLSPAPLGRPNITTHLILSTNDFYASLWPSPGFWVGVLVLGVLLTTAGLQQTVAAFQLARTGDNAALLTVSGEDDKMFLTSVHTEWLWADLVLRRLGMAAGELFFATLAWRMLCNAGYASLLFIMLLLLYTWVDNRLRETGQKLRQLIDERHAAERDALRSVVKTQVQAAFVKLQREIASLIRP